MPEAGSDAGAVFQQKRTRGGEKKEALSGNASDESGLSTNRSNATGASGSTLRQQSSSRDSVAGVACTSDRSAQVLTPALVAQKRAMADAELQQLIEDEESLRKAVAKLDAEEAKLMRHQIDRTRRLKLKQRQQTLVTQRSESDALQANVLRMERDLKILLQRGRLSLPCVLQDLLLLPIPDLPADDADTVGPQTNSNVQSLICALRMNMFEKIGNSTNLQLVSLVEEAESGRSNWLSVTPLDHIYLLVGLQREAASRVVALTPSSSVARTILSHGRRSTHFAIDEM
jgi:hypothetical protein